MICKGSLFPDAARITMCVGHDEEQLRFTAKGGGGRRYLGVEVL